MNRENDGRTRHLFINEYSIPCTSRLSLRLRLTCLGPARKPFISFCHAYHHTLGLGIDHLLDHRPRLFGA
jgi:hypothetical protein